MPSYIVCQLLKLLLIKTFNMQSPSSFIFYLLFYICLFNGFTQSDQAVSCTKKNLHHHNPLHLQNLIALKYILKEVWCYLPFFWNAQIQCPTSTSQTICILESEHSKHHCFEVFHDCGCSCCWLFLSTSLATRVKPQLLYHLWCCCKKTVATLFQFIFQEIWFDVTCSVGSLCLIQLNPLFTIP